MAGMAPSYLGAPYHPPHLFTRRLPCLLPLGTTRGLSSLPELLLGQAGARWETVLAQLVLSASFLLCAFLRERPR